MFRSFVARDWKGNLRINKYYEANRIVAKECTAFYFECWNKRNKLYHSEQKQLHMLKRWSCKSREYAIEIGGNIRLYVEVDPLKDNATNEYLRE